MASEKQQTIQINGEPHYNLLPNIQKIDLYDGLGYVELFDMLPRLVPVGRTADLYVVRNARTSTGVGDKPLERDRNLIYRLRKDRHTSVFEGVEFAFRVKIPIFVCRELMRHRTFNFNEFSMRYSKAPNEMSFPPLRMQDKVNHQSSNEIVDDQLPEDVKTAYQDGIDFCKKAYDKYEFLINKGVARECARAILPVSMMTVVMAKMDMHNLMNFLRLRMAKDAQKEIRVLAQAMYKLVHDKAPECFAAFKEFDLDPYGIEIE